MILTVSKIDMIHTRHLKQTLRCLRLTTTHRILLPCFFVDFPDFLQAFFLNVTEENYNTDISLALHVKKSLFIHIQVLLAICNMY